MPTNHGTAQDVVILSRARTPIGCLQGSLAHATAAELAACCIRQTVDDSGLRAEDFAEVILGNVVSAGMGQNPARQASIAAGLPVSLGATTVNKVCGSGLKAVMLGADAIGIGRADAVIAGGMESMSQAPFLLPKARDGLRLGHAQLLDAVIQDGLWDVYGQKHMGMIGEMCAAHYGFSREDQDTFAVRSYQRAIEATEQGVFKDEITPVTIQHRGKSVDVAVDEEPRRFSADKLRGLRPAFRADGTVTAGNASSINDGAAALVLASQQLAASRQLQPLARVAGSATFSGEPDWFTTAPIHAIKRLLRDLQWDVEQVDLWEINEAFSNVCLAAQQELEISSGKLNIYGGAVALGHPIGCTGARILVTLLTGLIRTGGRRGIASVCIGGGEAVAVALTRDQ